MGLLFEGKVLHWWDVAAGEDKRGNQRKNGNPDFTVGAKVGITPKGAVFVVDMQRERLSPLSVARIKFLL